MSKRSNIYVNYVMNTEEYNLARMEMQTIKRAREKFPLESIEFLADELGISVRTLFRKAAHYGIDLKKPKKRQEKTQTTKRPFFNGIN